MSDNTILIFFRKEGFYPIDALPDVPLEKQATEKKYPAGSSLRYAREALKFTEGL